jgi:hypothetical protein
MSNGIGKSYAQSGRRSFGVFVSGEGSTDPFVTKGEIMGRLTYRAASSGERHGAAQTPRFGGRSAGRGLFSSIRAGLLTLLVVAPLAVGATSASAIVLHLRSGNTISYQPLKGAAPAGAAPAIGDDVPRDRAYGAGVSRSPARTAGRRAWLKRR